MEDLSLAVGPAANRGGIEGFAGEMGTDGGAEGVDALAGEGAGVDG